MFEVKQYKHGEGNLWQLLGPFLVSPRVRRELGVPISSDEDTVWWLALDGEDVAGFLCASVKGSVCEFRHDYVVPGYRGRGVYRSLFQARLEYFLASDAQKARATVNDCSSKIYLEYGFQVVGKRGRYSVVEMVKDEQPV